MRLNVLLIFIVLILASCVVHGPKYTIVDRVYQIQTGQTKEEIDSILKIKPYFLSFYDTTGYKTFVYKYRVNDRKTIPFLLKEDNGKEIKGRYMDLYVYYDNKQVMYKIESRYTDSELKEKKVNINSLITFMTVTVPAVLVYFGLQSN